MRKERTAPINAPINVPIDSIATIRPERTVPKAQSSSGVSPQEAKRRLKSSYRARRVRNDS
jgi:hypothetical protein